MQFRFRYTLLISLVLLIPALLLASSSSPKGFYTLSISTQGGHLGKGKIYLKFNAKPINIFGDNFVQISEFSGATSFPVNPYIIEGSNTMEIKLVKSNKPNPKFVKSTAIIQFNLSYVKKGQMVSTSTQGALFSRRLTIKPGDLLKPVNITFNVKRQWAKIH